VPPQPQTCLQHQTYTVGFTGDQQMIQSDLTLLMINRNSKLHLEQLWQKTGTETLTGYAA